MRHAILIVVVMAGALAGRTTIGQSRDQGDWFLNDVRVPRNLVPGAMQKPIVIAIVDDAFRLTHRGLSDLLWTNPREIPGNRIDDDGNGHVDDVHGWDVSDDDGDVGAPANRTDLYHGTHLAGIIATMAKTAYGDAAPNVVRIMPIKSLADHSPTTTLVNGYVGVEYAIAAGADIILCSWGVGQITPRESRILQDAADKGILVVAAGGNLPEERDQFPAAHAAVLAISSTDEGGHKVVNANFGQFIDLAAPGVAIRSASAASDAGEEVHEGTSQAAAIAAAAAAIVKLQHPSFTPTEIEACLLSASTPIESPGREFSGKLGAGKLNVAGAVACPLIVNDTPPINRLVQTKGFLHVRSAGTAPIRWTIAPPGECAGIRFTPITGQARSARGRIEFRASPSTDAPVIASHAVDALPATIYVAGGAAYVTFIPEGVAQPADWLLKYEAAAIDFRTLYCRGTKEIGTEGVLTDGSGPENYSAATDCRWHIIAPAGKVIRFHVDEFDTEPKVDQVQFFNGSRTLQEQMIAIFSGPGTTPTELTTWGNEVLIWFVTDGKNQGRGWQMTYRFQDR
jgi:subtilisin family serine protease